MLDESSGLQLKGQSLITLIWGKMSARDLTSVVFPEPFGPRMRSPPILGFMAFIKMANLSLSRSTMAEKGRTTRLDMWLSTNLF